uniref:Uncharacterized protein n=1 Tax=Phytophthora ramorum TaxID=164328 RepID=H3GJ81_PHYRM
MWSADSGANDEDPREIQRRREAYARELDHQIALRRARQHQEQMEREELERKLAPSERSPAKWLVEGGHFELPAASQSPWKFAQSVELHDEQRQDRGAATGEANSVSSSHPRFRVTDESETSQRLRERAQQMQWKRMLDEQVQEKARLKELQQEERRRGEEDAAREEMRFLREQQLRAQRKLGHFSPAVNAELNDNRAEMNSPYPHTLPPPPDLTDRQRNDFQPTASSRHNFAFDRDPREEDKAVYYQRDRHYGSTGPAETLLPPPAPSRIQMQLGIERSSANDGGRDTFDRSPANGIVGRHLYPQENDAQESRQQLEQQSRMIDEYRSLLVEIRREREELRRERDEVRREKEELRVQRALLQLENEKMASLVDAQRALNEQHHTDLQTQQARQTLQQAQQQDQYQAVSYQHRLAPVQSVGFESNIARGGIALPDRSADVPEAQTFSRLNQLRETLGELNIQDDQAHPAVQGRRRKPPSPMSMADFSAPTPDKRMTVNAMESPRFQRLSRYRPIPAVPACDESVLNQSLVGESVFVPLSPKSQNQNNNGPAPRATASPTAADRRGDNDNRRANPLRSSRVIKSRGFYDFEQETKSDNKVDSFASESVSGRDSFGSDLGSSFYGEGGESDAEDELDELDSHNGDERVAASSGLFQVQVLV